MKAIELRLRIMNGRGEISQLHAALYEATAAYASAFTANSPKPPTPSA
jgi:hypothetical protein